MKTHLNKAEEIIKLNFHLRLQNAEILPCVHRVLITDIYIELKAANLAYYLDLLCFLVSFGFQISGQI